MNVVVDSSVLVAILTEEPGFELYRQFLADVATHVSLPAPILLETLMVMSGRGFDAEVPIRLFLEGRNSNILPFGRELLPLAHDAFLRFGRGRHPAALNFGDCMAYALAKSLDAPLLFKGDDFRKTDVIAAL